VVTFDVAALNDRLSELEEELAKPDFWSDQQRAAKLSAEHTRTQRKLQRFETLQGNYRFLQESAGVFPDEELEPVLRETRQELERLQEDALFSGEYDAGDAVVTIQADAGGTDAQDWAEILLRMYLRWAAERGFQTEVLDTSPGEEYGSSRRRSRSRERTRTASSRPSAASTGSSGSRPSTRRTAGTRASRR
jgi:peptide chain release factor 2